MHDEFQGLGARTSVRRKFLDDLETARTEFQSSSVPEELVDSRKLLLPDEFQGSFPKNLFDDRETHTMNVGVVRCLIKNSLRPPEAMKSQGPSMFEKDIFSIFLGRCCDDFRIIRISR